MKEKKTEIVIEESEIIIVDEGINTDESEIYGCCYGPIVPLKPDSA